MQQMVVSTSPDMSSKKLTYSKLYAPVLSELRRIKSSNLWSETSVARSTVIRQDTVQHPSGSDEVQDSAPPTPRKNGTFTIVNPKVEQNWDSLPLGNKLFPELVEAVFDLEIQLAGSVNETCMITNTDDNAH